MLPSRSFARFVPFCGELLDTNEHESYRYGGVTREMNVLLASTSCEFVSIRVHSWFNSCF